MCRPYGVSLYFRGCGKNCWGNGEWAPWPFIPSPHHCCSAYLPTLGPCSVSWFVVKPAVSAQLRSRLTPHRTRFYCATLCPDFPWQPQACFSELKPRSCSRSQGLFSIWDKSLLKKQTFIPIGAVRLQTAPFHPHTTANWRQAAACSRQSHASLEQSS